MHGGLHWHSTFHGTAVQNQHQIKICGMRPDAAAWHGVVLTLAPGAVFHRWDPFSPRCRSALYTHMVSTPIRSVCAVAALMAMLSAPAWDVSASNFPHR